MQKITFPTSSPVVLGQVNSQAAQSRMIDAVGELYLPQAHDGPRPAVILVQGLGGVKDARERTYGPMLAELGYVALVVDSFATRNADKTEHTLRALKVTEAMILADAFAALGYLADHPAVDSDRINIAGFSYGGMITVLTAYDQIARLYRPDGLRFAGHVSYYGSSIPRLDDPTATGAPVLIMLGGLDRNVQIARTHQIADDLRGGGAPVEVIVFEDAYHQWDADDIERRFVLFSLHDCRMRVGRDNRIRDEGLGVRYGGKFLRGLCIARQTSIRGYHIQRCEKTLSRSNALLLDFLAKGSDSQSQSAGSGLVRESAA